MKSCLKSLSRRKSIAGGRSVPCSPGLYTAQLGSRWEGGRVSAWGGVHWGPVLVPCGFEELGDLTNVSAGPEASPRNSPHVEMTGCVLIAEMGWSILELIPHSSHRSERGALTSPPE